MMPLTFPAVSHFLQHLFSDIRSRGDKALLYEKREEFFKSVTHRETVARIADFVRGLAAAHIEPGERVTLYAAASATLLISEWGVLASRCVAVIVPRGFSPEELMDTLTESKSGMVIVDRLATAYHLATSAATLPDLKHILCFEGSAQASIPIWSWNDFIDSGRMEADRSMSLMRSITEKDTALLFYYKDAAQQRQATRYTHALLLEHTARIESLLKEATIQKEELVLTATAWEHPIGHITSCYLPVMKDAIVQITHGVADVGLFENGPQVIVGDAVFFDGLRQNILKLVRQSGIESVLLNHALALSKINYEKMQNSAFARFRRSFLKATVIKKVRKLLGERVRLFIGTDNEAHYEIQLFFHTFGIELIELPQEVFR